MLLFLLFLGQPLFSQQSHQYTDSILKLIPEEKNSLAKARHYKSLVIYHMDSNPEKAIEYANQGLKFSEKSNLSRGVGVFNSYLGNIYQQKGNVEKAMLYYRKSYDINKKDKDFENLASTLNNIANVYLGQSEYEKAIKTYFEALQIAEKTKNNYLKAKCLGNIGIVFSAQENLDKSLYYYDKSLQISKKENDIENTANVTLLIANLYTKKKDTVQAKKRYFEALIYFKKTNSLADIATTYQNLSILYKDYKTNLKYKLEAQKIWDKIGSENVLSLDNLGNLAYEYLRLAKLKKDNKIKFSETIPYSRNELLLLSNNCLKKSFLLLNKEKNIGNYSFLKEIEAELEAEKGNFKEAFESIKIYYKTNDSIFSQESKNKIAKIESQKQIDLKNKEIKTKAIELKANQRQKWFLIAGLTLLGIIGGLLFYQNQNRKKTNQLLQNLNTELEDANQAKTRFFSILNHDLRSPVSNLIDFLHLQKDSPDLLDEATKNRIEQTTLSSVENLLTSMEDILQWSKSQMENFKPQPKIVGINSLYEDTKKHFSSEEKVQLVFENSNNIEINTDENYLKTIIRNLTNNAIKATSEIENPTIIWKAFQEDGKTNISITDNGKGASDEQFKALYDEKEVVGIKSGLGLHLIRDLAKAIGCEITVESKINEGTTFVLRL